MSVDFSLASPRTIQVYEWLRAKTRVQTEIALDTDLLEFKILDSLQFMSFTLFLEELAGREIDMSTLSLDTFRTLRAIENEFFSDVVA